MGRSRELVRGNKNPVTRATKSEEAKFPLDETAHEPEDALAVVQLVSDNEPHFLELIPENRIESLQEKAAR